LTAWEQEAEFPSSWSGGPLEPFLTGREVHRIPAPTIRDADTVFAERRLQDVVDYRATLRDWFGRLRVGGHLVVTVPHAFLHERLLALPSPWSAHTRRLYTPASLSAEVEEALAPNNYRVRFLGDLDRGYDYHLPHHAVPAGECDVAIVLERIEPPEWDPAHPVPVVSGVTPPLPAPDFAFVPERTRMEVDRTVAVRRLLVMKLDHLGDLIMGTPALERLREVFPDSAIDLMVGSWNAAMARDLGVADRVIAFDAFPRNSSEEEPNVMATLGHFRETVTDEYDLAIDLRADGDTRPLLRAVRAPIKAGLGTRAQFPFLDIALPLNDTRNEAARARDDRIGHAGFTIQGSGRRGHFALSSDKNSVERDCAIIWGPYLELDPGEYIFDFYLDLEEQRGDGLLRLDIAVEGGRRVAEKFISGPGVYQLPFRIERPRTAFEARISTVDGHPSISFSFYGGHLVKRGPGNVLHQSEYGLLLVELVRIRVQHLGIMSELPA
jgi:hypothetical protein